jgi:hypothetical protein
MTITPHTNPQAQHKSRGRPPRTIHLPPSVLTLVEMNAAIETGEVSSPLFRQDLMHYRDRWWELTYDFRWAEVTHTPAIASYDTAAANMTPEVGHGLRTANIRAAMHATEPWCTPPRE